MNTFLVKYENEIFPCYGITERGNELLAIVKNYEFVKKHDIVLDSDGFFEIQFASKEELQNSLLSNDLPFGEIKTDMINRYEVYPTPEEVAVKLNNLDYFQTIINRIVKFINVNHVVPLDEIAYESMMDIYTTIMNEETKTIYR